MKDFKTELTIEKAREIVRCKSIEAADEDFNKYRNVDLYPARAFIQAWEQQEGKIKRLVKKADREARIDQQILECRVRLSQIEIDKGKIDRAYHKAIREINCHKKNIESSLAKYKSEQLGEK